MNEIVIRFIAISKDEYVRLLKAERELNYLREHGVDNWEGYSEAIQNARKGENLLDLAEDVKTSETLLNLIQG